MDYDAKLLEAKALLDRGSYTLAVMAMGKLLEAIYEDFYDEVLGKLPPAQRKIITDREAQSAEQIKDRAAREKGFKGFTIGAKLRFFRENKFIDSAEGVLGRKYPRFRVFDPGMLKDIRNEATHEASDDVDEDEATLFYSQIKVLLAELGYSKKPEPAPARGRRAALVEGRRRDPPRRHPRRQPQDGHLRRRSVGRRAQRRQHAGRLPRSGALLRADVSDGVAQGAAG
ncbi:MAG: hypothetical protein HND48_03940 [Chloroflexi bacterium]|nr:hypothetical protein [Chloroflexota bacterium]